MVQLMRCVEIERKVEEAKVNPSGFFIQNKFKVNKKFMTENQLNFLPFFVSDELNRIEMERIDLNIREYKIENIYFMGLARPEPQDPNVLLDLDFNMARIRRLLLILTDAKLKFFNGNNCLQ